MLRNAASKTPPAAAPARHGQRRCQTHTFGYKDFKGFWLEPGADKKYSTIYWGEHLFDQNMVGYNEDWHDPMPSSVPSQEEFGIDDSLKIKPPGAYPGVNRPWVGHKPSKVTNGYYGGGHALRDTWGPDADQDMTGSQAKPEVFIKRVSVDYFLDEFSAPANAQNSVMISCNARHTRNFRINAPQAHNLLDRKMCQTLFWHVQESTNALERRVTMLGACQNGKTEWFCKGLPLAHYAGRLRWVVEPPQAPSEGFDAGASSQVERLAELLTTQRNVPSETAERSEVAITGALHADPDDEGLAGRLLHAANKQAVWLENQMSAIPTHELSPPKVVYEIAEDVRWAYKMLYVLGQGDSPTLSFVNGKAHNVGAGVALLANYAALRNEAEISYHGAAVGTTPTGGLLRMLRDPAVDTKYPGLGEYMMLSGDFVCYGDAKRLGWTAVHAPTDIQLNERMLQDYMNMHGPGEGHHAERLLHSALFNDTDQSPEMDRCSITAKKAQWIKECFAGKATVHDITAALRAVVADTASADDVDTETVIHEDTKQPLMDRTMSKQRWAGNVLALLERYSPTALVASLAMLQKARRERLSLTECMALEYRCFMRLVTKKDFVRAQVCIGDTRDATWPAGRDDWNDELGCPHWSPATLAEVDADAVATLVNTELDWRKDGTVELNVETEAMEGHGFLKSMDAVGVEVVQGLGQDESLAAEDTAYLPKGVNIYREARHPTTGVIGTDRSAAVLPSQLEYRKQRLQEAEARIRNGQGRVFDMATNAALGDYDETPAEARAREGQQRWDEARIAAERAANTATYEKIQQRIDVGGERVLAPDGEYHFSRPFPERRETEFGAIPDYNASTLTHIYNHASGVPPKQVRNWEAVERYAAAQRQQGKSKEDIAAGLLQNDF